MMKFKKKNAIVLGVLLSMAMAIPAGAVDSANIHRIDGKDRIDTSLKSAEMVNSKVLVLASGYSYADSLSASNIVFKTGGKLVLVNNKTDLVDILKDNQFDKIYIVGGLSTIGQSVEDSAKKISKEVIRIAGANRYATNEATLKKFDIKDVGVADGGNYPDALSASSLLKEKSLGLLLVDGTREYKTDYNVKYTFGGSVKQDGGKRLSGANRYATNEAILNELGQKDNIAIASGNGFPDALSAMNVVNAKDAAVVLVDNNKAKLNDKTEKYVDNAKDAYVLGGTSTISNSTVKDILEKETSDETSEKNTTRRSTSRHSSSKYVSPKDKILNESNKYLQDTVIKGINGLDLVKKNADVVFDGNKTTTITLKDDQIPTDLNDIKDTHFVEKIKNTPNLVGYEVGDNITEDGSKKFVIKGKSDKELKTDIITKVMEALGKQEGTLNNLDDINGKIVNVKAYYEKDGVKTDSTYEFKFVVDKDAIKKAETNRMVENADKHLNDNVIATVSENAAIKTFGSVEFNKDTRTTTVTINEDKLKENINLEEIKNTGFISNLVKTPNLIEYTVEGVDNPRVIKKYSDNPNKLKDDIIEDVLSALDKSGEIKSFGDLNGKEVKVNAHYNDNEGHEATITYTFNFEVTSNNQ